MTKNSSLWAIALGISLIIAAIIIGEAYKYKFRTAQTISVTGMAEKDFESNLIVWNGSYSRNNMDLKTAYARLKDDEGKIKSYLSSKGIADSNVVFSAVNILKLSNPQYSPDGRVIGNDFAGYELTQTVKVESKEIDKVERLSREITALIETGIELNSSAPLYFNTQLADLKLELLAKASADAKKRATSIADNSGSKVGNVMKAIMGIFQITAQNGNEDYSYGGTFNTTARYKTGSITIRMEFRAK